MAADAGLPDDVGDLLADAASAVDATYRVAYDLPDGSVVVTQRPPDRRVDVTTEGDAVDATISLEGTTYACTDPPGGDPWRCEVLGGSPADGSFEAEDLTALTERLAANAGSYEFIVEDREVIGTEARCLVTRLRSGADVDPSLGAEGTLCIADTGAMLLVERPSGTLRATEYSTDIADDAFDLPAFPPAD